MSANKDDAFSLLKPCWGHWNPCLLIPLCPVCACMAGNSEESLTSHLHVHMHNKHMAEESASRMQTLLTCFLKPTWM